MAVKPATIAKIRQSGQLLQSTWGLTPLKVISDIVTLNSQAVGDTIPIGVPIPKGARFLYAVLITSVSLGSSKIALGFQDDPDDFRIHAALTNSDTPQFSSATSDDTQPLSQDKQVLLSLTVAALPADGHLLVHLFYVL